MNYGESGGGLSASDVALLTGNNWNNGFGGENGSWWIIIFLIFALTGWGGRGNGFGGGNDGGVADNYVLVSDFAQLSRQLSDGFASQERKLDSITNGLCDGFYTTAQQINSVNTNILTSSFGIQNAINTLGYNLQDCCCKTQRAIDGVNYNMAMGINTLQNTMCNNTRDIIENQNNNYRALHDEIVANRIEDKNAQIQMLQTKLNNAELRASQEAQSAYLLNELKPCPNAAYIVPNPNCCYDYTVTRNTGCGCGCN